MPIWTKSIVSFTITCWKRAQRIASISSPSDVFETFPRPSPTDWLDNIGRRLDTERREIMLRRQLGPTKLYNLINDPDIADSSDADVAKLRAIHVELDEAVMDAYGWTDVPLDHGSHVPAGGALEGEPRGPGGNPGPAAGRRT